MRDDLCSSPSQTSCTLVKNPRLSTRSGVRKSLAIQSFQLPADGEVVTVHTKYQIICNDMVQYIEVGQRMNSSSVVARR